MFNFFHKDDDKILTDVRNELSWDPSVDSESIKVSIQDGFITLSGYVPHFYEKYNAETAAYRVGGVKGVKDMLAIDAMDHLARSDDQITVAARTALEWNYRVPAGLKAITDAGFITLTGQVDWDYQRAAAYNAVSTLTGVRGVENNITIKPQKVDSQEIKSQIENALKRAASTEGSEVKVKVVDGKVTLSGKLDSYEEIETARIAAWNAPGVSNVVNHLSLRAQI